MNQKEQVLNHMAVKGSITQKDALDEYGIMRLASRISDLKKLGYGINTVMETGRNRYGETTHYARYSLR